MLKINFQIWNKSLLFQSNWNTNMWELNGKLRQIYLREILILLRGNITANDSNFDKKYEYYPLSKKEVFSKRREATVYSKI